MESLSENLTHFYKYIPLNQKMTIDEAIQKLAYYHNSNRENVLAAFMNLRDFTEGTVEFRKSVNSGYACIVMEGKTPDGKFSWNHLIDMYTGNPQMRCG